MNAKSLKSLKKLFEKYDKDIEYNCNTYDSFIFYYDDSDGNYSDYSDYSDGGYTED